MLSLGTKKCKIILKRGKKDVKRSYFAKYSCFKGIYATKGLLVKHLPMSKPIATQIAAAFTRWRCKSRGTPGYPGVQRVASH